MAKTTKSEFIADPETLRVVGQLCRSRARLLDDQGGRNAEGPVDPNELMLQLAKDLEATAAFLELGVHRQIGIA